MDRLPAATDDDELITAGEPIWDVVRVEAVAPLTLVVEFEDGLTGRVRFTPSYLTGVFERLNDHSYFAQVGIAHGAVSWPDEAPDMSPERMHDELVKNGGVWVLQ